MKYCENCGAKLPEGVKFCEECGSAVAENAENAEGNVSLEESTKDVKLPEETLMPIVEASEPLSLGDAPRSTAGQPLINGSMSGKSRKKPLVTILAIFMLLAGAAIATWRFAPLGDFGKKVQSTAVTPTEAIAIDQGNLYGTLNWKEDQDKEYELKNSLIEGNSDSNVKEIFQESAYFTPTRYAYAANENMTYYSIGCEYEKEDKTVPYVLVFQVNQDKHLELAELYKNEKKLDKEKFEGFYEKLYTTKEDLEAKEKAKETC